LKRGFLYFVLALILTLSLTKYTVYPDLFSLQKCCKKVLEKTIPPLSGLDLETGEEDNDDDGDNNITLEKVPFRVNRIVQNNETFSCGAKAEKVFMRKNCLNFLCIFRI
jgi:hypothetical protein